MGKGYLLSMVLLAMEPPFFMTATTHTEDVYFCLKTRDLEPRPEIYMHTGIRCGHILNAEPIEWANRSLMKSIYTPLAQGFKRDENYIKQCLAKLG